MASSAHKLAKNAPFLRTVAALLKPQLLAKPTLISHHTHLGPPKPEFTENPVSHSGHNAQSSQLFPIFPNFPFGYCLNPISPTGFENLGVCEADSADARTIWADSVKKKRKKKMNKHKYKKLRKRLRRKSRA